MTFQQKLDRIIEKNNSLVCVGLDPVLLKLPSHLRNIENPFFVFNKLIVDVTHDLVCAYKPNSAFYEALGMQGISQLKMTCDYIREMNPEIPIILDAKRGDIGSTNIGYVQFAFDYLQVDAITLHPYLGVEALLPFLERTDKGCMILCHTSNAGAGELQNLLVNNEPLYKVVTRKVATEWNTKGNCMVVAGATFPEELAEIRKLIGDITILSPGVGAQKGMLTKTVTGGINTKKQGLIINSSRGIIYASHENDFTDKVRMKTMELRNDINNARFS